MKKIIFILTGVILFLVACENDSKVVLNPSEFVASEWIKGDNGSIFPEKGDVFVLSKEDAELPFDVLTWSATDFSYKAAVTYSIQMAVEKEDGTITSFKTVDTTNKTERTIKVKDINTWILNGGGLKRQTNKMYVRISASISDAYMVQISDTYQFTATTFSTDPDLLYFVSAAATDGVETAEYIFAPKWDGDYNGFAYIPYGKDGVWLVEEINPDIKWGISSSTATGASLTLVTEEDGGQPIMPGAFGTGDVEASFTESGYYRASVNLKPGATNKTIQVWRFYDKFFIAGQRNMNYKEWGMNMGGQNPDIPAWNLKGTGNVNDYVVWGTGATLTYYPEERVWKTDVVYVPKYQTGAGAPPQAENTSAFEFKLRANWAGTFDIETGSVKASWLNAANLGGAVGSGDMVNDEGVQSGKIDGSKNIKMNAAAGYYYWKVYLNSYPNRYELIPAEKD